MWTFGRKLPVETFSTAVLIDMQQEFVSTLETKTRDELVAAQTAVIRHCVAKDVPLVVLMYREQGAVIQELRLEIRKVPRIAVIVRDEYDGFYRTGLEQTLDMFGAESLLLMGINASCCVRQTAETALQKKFRIITASDLIADSSSVIGPTRGTEGWFKRKCVLVSHAAMLFAP
jgi:nicotinamidase-related amidase